MKVRNGHTGKMIKIMYKNNQYIYFFVIYNVKAKAIYYRNEFCRGQISTASI